MWAICLSWLDLTAKPEVSQLYYYPYIYLSFLRVAVPTLIVALHVLWQTAARNT